MYAHPNSNKAHSKNVQNMLLKKKNVTSEPKPIDIFEVDIMLINKDYINRNVYITLAQSDFRHTKWFQFVQPIALKRYHRRKKLIQLSLRENMVRWEE